MLRRVALLPILFLYPPAHARPAPVESWSKPGVTFAQYRADAVDCAQLGYFRDISDDEPAKRFIRGWKTADDLLNGISSAGDTYADVVRRTQPDRQRRDIHAIQIGDVERCLTGKGYARFTLSGAEARTLRRYKPGSPERHRYMHNLATSERPA